MLRIFPETDLIIVFWNYYRTNGYAALDDFLICYFYQDFITIWFTLLMTWIIYPLAVSTEVVGSYYAVYLRNIGCSCLLTVLSSTLSHQLPLYSVPVIICISNSTSSFYAYWHYFLWLFKTVFLRRIVSQCLDIQQPQGRYIPASGHLRDRLTKP